MNKSKLIATSAIATVMTATAAQAELSISGGMAGWWLTGDSITSVNRQWNTESVNVTYSDTLDNGMGISVTANVGETGNTHTGFGSDSSDDANYTMTSHLIWALYLLVTKSRQQLIEATILSV